MFGSALAVVVAVVDVDVVVAVVPVAAAPPGRPPGVCANSVAMAAATISSERANLVDLIAYSPPPALGFPPAGFASGAFGSTYMNVLATKSAPMVRSAWLPNALMEICSTLMIREKLLRRLNRIARLWYRPSSEMEIGHSTNGSFPGAA